MSTAANIHRGVKPTGRSKMDNTAELIERLERAQGPDRDLDKDIAVACSDLFRNALRTRLPQGGWVFKASPYSAVVPSPSYTESIDAALTLIPANAHWEVKWDMYNGFEAGVNLWDQETCGYMFFKDARATTPAIALCIAALKARTAV